MESSSDGPYSRLAQQLQDQMQENDGNLSIDRILGRNSTFRPVHIANDNIGSSDNTKQARLAMARPVRKYKAKYEIEQTDSNGEERRVDQEEPRSARQEFDHEDQEMEEVPRKRGSKAGSKGISKASTAKKGAAERGDERVPGRFTARQVADATEKKQGKDASKVTPTPVRRRSSRRITRTFTDDSANEEDEVPDLLATPTVNKSKTGGAALSRSRSATQMASTPVRRSARLSVEPESTPYAQKERDTSVSPTKEKRSKRANQKGPPSLASASEVEETENEKEGGHGVSTRTRRKSKMPGSF
jgi:hypothetical protein